MNLLNPLRVVGAVLGFIGVVFFFLGLINGALINTGCSHKASSFGDGADIFLGVGLALLVLALMIVLASGAHL